jgi:glutamine synthetase
MPRTRQKNVSAAQWSPNGTATGPSDLSFPGAIKFADNVFGTVAQRQRLPKDVFKKLQATIDRGEPLDEGLADQVAAAMKDWALEKGATHYSHWFQPLTGSTAEKHDSFFSPVGDGTALAEFSGKELVKGEPDASSFPSGGIRVTFEARGYTAWDPTSPAFILENPNGSHLCIPTAFASWTGEALDAKIPLLRSMAALSKSAVRALRLMGDTATQHVFTTIGPEQEYFLIDEQFFYERPDLVSTGRTLFGAKPAKGQELDDHYFGSIPERVLAFMLESEKELFKLGVPIKTRHNEVAPGQFELAPIFENSNVGTDHQQLAMQILKNVARRYDMVCLLHEKPFAGVNGSGKHNNWSMSTDTGSNLMNPGSSPHTNLQFLFFCTAVITAVYKYQGLLRATVAGAGQDHRLGANEAPPAIISIFLGKELEGVYDAIEKGEVGSSTAAQMMALGSPVLPPLPKDAGDRNRTSPFAFTGNRFEFRALGSSQSPSLANTVLNTVVAEAIDSLCEDLELAMAPKGKKPGKTFAEALPPVIQKAYKSAKKIIFDGNGYSEEWHKEAKKRGLLNLPSTPEALPQLITQEAIAVFSNYGVLDERELHARYEVGLEQYVIVTNTEAETGADIAATMILPAAVRYLGDLKAAGLTSLAKELTTLIGDLDKAIKKLQKVNLIHDDATIEKEAAYMHDVVLPALGDVRAVADVLERTVADDLWPLPKYSEMLLIR